MAVWLSLFFILFCVFSIWAELKLPIPLSGPIKIHPDWYSRFPDATGEEIGYFLELVVESFVFGSPHKFKLDPDQSLMSIFQALNPVGKADESLEIESLIMVMEREYGCELSVSLDCNLTLAALFAKVRYINPTSLNRPVIYIRPDAN